MSSPKFCAECGDALKPNVKFCSNCGAKTGSTAAVPEPTPPPPAEEAPPPAPAPTAPAPEPEKVAEKAREPSPPQSAPAAEQEPAAAPATDESSAFKDPIAALLAGDDDDDDEDHLPMPEEGKEAAPRELPIGAISLGLLAVLLIGGGGYIGADDELSARFQCNILGRKGMCVTEADRLYEIEKQEKQEELDLMRHHYGGFDLNFSPEKDATFTLKQTRYEETREQYVKRLRGVADDSRVRKEEKIGAYSTGTNSEGVVKGLITFKKSAQPPTFKPAEGMELVLPLSLAELPLMEREQVEVSNPEKRLSADDVIKIDHQRNNPERDADGKIINEIKLRVRTVALSSWIYEIELSSLGFESRTVLFYETPLPPDLDEKKLEEAGKTLRAFKKRPDGKYVIANASFDLLPEPKTIRTRYIQLLKELHCLRKSKEYEGKSEQGKSDAEDLIWEQKGFTKVLREIAEKNHELPDWEEYKTKEFSGYQCPKPIVNQAR
jgi:hypothetical protein